MVRNTSAKRCMVNVSMKRREPALLGDRIVRHVWKWSLVVFGWVSALAGAEPAAQQPDNVATEIVKVGGKVEVDEKDADKAILKVSFGGKSFKDEHLQLLKGLPKLRTIEMRYISYHDTGLKYLSDISTLEVLTIVHCTFGAPKGSGFAHFKELKHLHTLELEGALGRFDGLAHLKDVASLRTLSLKGSRMLRDDDLQHIKALTQLRSLRLDDCDKLTDAGVGHLKDLTNLEALWLRKTPHISDAAVKKLQEALPKTKIER
jgi:hypothetical protein